MWDVFDSEDDLDGMDAGRIAAAVEAAILETLKAIEAPSALQARVKRGAELLDKFRPGWRSGINRIKLDLGSCKKCILGQMFGDYEVAELTPIVGHRLWHDEQVEHGFDKYTESYDALTAAWLEELGV